MESYDADEVRGRIEDRLKPGGEYIGKPGGQGGRAKHVRKNPINEYEPESFFRELVEGGVELGETGYPGILMSLPGVRIIGLRPPTGAKPYTMDARIKGARIKEWKFVEPGEY